MGLSCGHVLIEGAIPESSSEIRDGQWDTFRVWVVVFTTDRHMFLNVGAFYYDLLGNTRRLVDYGAKIYYSPANHEGI